jgi:hypothetical protein
MAKVGLPIMLLLSGFGEVLNMTICIYTFRKTVRNSIRDYHNTLKNITMNDLTFRWIIEHQQGFISGEKKKNMFYLKLSFYTLK